MKISDINTKTLPKDFVWGVATSSYQIEGGFESGDRGRCIWDDFCDQPGAISDGTRGGIGIDHIKRFKEDIGIMELMGIDSYRFSFSWPRVQKGGSSDFNLKGLEFYDSLIDSLLEKNITPNATLYHWDLPSELQAAGGWTNPKTTDLFGEYAAFLAKRFGDRIKFWAPINEPWCVTYLGNTIGHHAPGLRDLTATVKVAHQLVRAHALAAQAIKANSDGAKVGPVLNLADQVFTGEITPEIENDLNLVSGMVNNWWLQGMLNGKYPENVLDNFEKLTGIRPNEDEIPDTKYGRDWVGLNYYNAQIFQAGEGLEIFPGTKYLGGAWLGDEKTDIGWPWTPEGIRKTLHIINDFSPNIPIYVTENGACYNTNLDSNGHVYDSKREAYLARYINEVVKAKNEGVNLKGYYSWSLLDNFEWAFGYEMRFGMVHVNYENYARTLKQSGHEYSNLIKRHKNGS
jgi:beta-glucosidase